MIGRELYTAPFIWVPADKTECVQGTNGKWKCNDNFKVLKITYTKDGQIDGLIISSKKNKQAFVQMPKGDA